jgi:pantoate--beta-alanine ligase
MNQPDVLTSIAVLRGRIGTWREAASRIALVPTMGALHAGHVSLVDIAKDVAERTIVSIFVNPKQFAPGEDFDRYPRTFEADLEKLGAIGVDAVFAPPVTEIYPPGFATTITLAGPAVAGLEDRFRPTHFQGVATVVTKLLIAALPDVAIFGEKDFQQLQVIGRLVADLALPVEIIGAPIAREQDGLAMSSRNAYLSAAERAVAPALNFILRQCETRIRRGEAVASVLDAGRADAAAAGFVLDYLELRDAETLAPVAAPSDRPCRLLVAAYLGRTRLIDNIAILALDAETERKDPD